MFNPIFIYGLVDPRNNKVRYVGKTNNLHSRLLDHIRYAKEGRKSHKCSWIRQVLKDEKNPIIRILEIATEDNWNTLEQKWIINFDNLTNQTKKGKLHTEEHKANLKKAWVKRKSREANE